MATTPRSKAATKEAIQKDNPLDNLGSNLGSEDDRVPNEFRAPAVAVQPEAIEIDVKAVLGADYDSYMAWKAQKDAEALASATHAADAPAKPAVEFQTSISESGRAPKVEAKDRVWIILDDNDEIPPGGQFIGVNGVGYMLMAGVEAFVPRAVCEVLDHAVKSIPIQDANTKRVIGWRPRKRFPYTIVNKQGARAES